MMIDWNKIDYNKELNIELIEGENVITLTVKLISYEWSPQRQPTIADIKIVKTDDKRFISGDILRLPIITRDIEESFMISCPRPIKPSNYIKFKARVVLN